MKGDRPGAGDREPAAEAVGDLPAPRSTSSCPPGWPGWTRCWMTRCSSPRMLRISRRCPAAADPGRDLPADDVPEVPLPAGLRDAAPGIQLQHGTMLALSAIRGVPGCLR